MRSGWRFRISCPYPPLLAAVSISPLGVAEAEARVRSKAEARVRSKPGRAARIVVHGGIGTAPRARLLFVLYFSNGLSPFFRRGRMFSGEVLVVVFSLVFIFRLGRVRFRVLFRLVL